MPCVSTCVYYLHRDARPCVSTLFHNEWYKSMKHYLLLLLCCWLLVPISSFAQQGTILHQQLNAQGHGYTVIRVWGTHHQMGYAYGYLLAREILKGIDEIKAYIGQANYLKLRLLIGASIWRPLEIEDELDGMVSGIKAAHIGANLDKTDLKIINTLSDWFYACRSHSAWGKFVMGATKTLSTRRLDFAIPIKTVYHHVLVARQPSDGSVRWVNLAWPGYVTVITGLNEYGTLASLHDYKSHCEAGAYMPRSVAVRYALTLVGGLPLNKHLDAVYNELRNFQMATSTFINYYVPEGMGGVITCMKAELCSKKRVPQVDYFGGEVLITTNSETDGRSTPEGGDFMDRYYRTSGVKTLADHYAVMGNSGLHLLSLEYRKFGDMTIWFNGQLPTGNTPTVKLEFAQLFASSPPVENDLAEPSTSDEFSSAQEPPESVADAAVEPDLAPPPPDITVHVPEVLLSEQRSNDVTDRSDLSDLASHPNPFVPEEIISEQTLKDASDEDARAYIKQASCSLCNAASPEQSMLGLLYISMLLSLLFVLNLHRKTLAKTSASRSKKT